MALNTQGLQEAYTRQQRGQSNQTDDANLKYAMSKGWTPPTSPPGQPGPTIRRTDDGGIEERADPRSIVDRFSNLESFNNSTQFLEAAKKVIQMKQKATQPLSEQKAFWRTLQTSTTPFGGMVSPAVSPVGQFADERFREMSPGDQSSIRASRYGAAQAHLRGIREEEEYRGGRIEDLMSSMSSIMAEKNKLSKEASLAEGRALDILKKKKDLNIPLDDSDYKKIGVISIDNKVGGTISWQHNNPLNLKYAKWEDKYGATPGKAGTDGGRFALFPDVETAYKAYKQLLGSDAYKDLSLEKAMRKWSGNGYGAEVFPNAKLFGPSLSMQKVLDDPVMYKQLMDAMKVREGWVEGTILGADEQVEHTMWTEAAVRTLAQKVPGKNSTELWENYTDAELDKFAEDAGTDLVTLTVAKIPPQSLLRIGLSKEQAKEILTLQSLGVPSEEIKSLMTELGMDASKYEDLMLILKNIDKTTGSSFG